MSDPAIEAGQRAVDALDKEVSLTMDDWDLLIDTSVASAREALKPIREWFEWWNGVESDPPPPQAWGELAKLIYTTEELGQ